MWETLGCRSYSSFAGGPATQNRFAGPPEERIREIEFGILDGLTPEGTKGKFGSGASGTARHLPRQGNAGTFRGN